MISHCLQTVLPDMDLVLDPVLVVSSLLKLVSTKVNPSPAGKFAGELDTFTKCILSEAEAMSTTASNVLEIQINESISKAIEEWATFTGRGSHINLGDINLLNYCIFFFDRLLRFSSIS